MVSIKGLTNKNALFSILIEASLNSNYHYLAMVNQNNILHNENNVRQKSTCNNHEFNKNSDNATMIH
ncbi:hypothetical protein A9266_02830 [Vibrio tasmaniensis]|nr:hypothetical protein A9266_02830 [Vibrio tasmaniensis]